MTEKSKADEWLDGAVSRRDALCFMGIWLAVEFLYILVPYAWRGWHG